jgi:hypothetical protein
MSALNRLVCLLATLLAGPALAQTGALEGRWEGEAEGPGLVVPVVLDLAPRGDGWAGAATLPGRGARGAALSALALQGSTLSARLPGAAEIGFELQLAPDGAVLSGRFLQGGHAASLVLRRRGPAQLDPAPPATAWPAALDGTWRGRYDIGLGPREVTLRLAGAGSAMTVIGRRTTEVAFDEQRVLGAFLFLRAAAFDIAIEAPLVAGARLDALIRQGPFESALVLQREATP